MTAQAQVISINKETELDNKVLSLYEQSTSLVITDPTSYAAAGEVGKALKLMEKEITDFFEPMRISAKNAYDEVLKKKNEQLAPVTEATAIVRKTINTYLQEQERIRQETERKARIQAEEAAKKERECLEAQALKAMESGKEEKADSLMEKAEMIYVQPVTIAPVVDKTVRTESGNITQAKETQITIVDQILFIKTLCEKNPGAIASILKIGDGPLKSFIKANGLTAYPGLVVKQTVSARF